VLFTVFALSFALIQEPTAPVQTPADAPAEDSGRAADQTQNNDEQIICRRETVSGTNRRERICMSRDQWLRRQASAQEHRRDVQTPDVSGRAPG